MKPDYEEAPLSDAELEWIIQQVQSGHKEPFRFLVQHYQRRIHVYCHHMLGDKQETEDAVQDIFVKCYTHLGSYTENLSFSSWLYRIAYNHCINLLKKRSAWYKRFQSYCLQQLTESSKPDYSDSITELLDQLSSEEKSLILMRIMEERSFEEIGQIMGCKPATARKKYERIKSKLRPFWSRQVEGTLNET